MEYRKLIDFFLFYARIIHEAQLNEGVTTAETHNHSLEYQTPSSTLFDLLRVGAHAAEFCYRQFIFHWTQIPQVLMVSYPIMNQLSLVSYKRECQDKLKGLS